MYPTQIIIDLVEGDTAPDLRVRFSGLDLSQFSKIEMHIKKASGDSITRTVTPDPIDPELATVTWQATDLVRGRALAEFEFTRLTGGRFTLPQRSPVVLDIRGDLG